MIQDSLTDRESRLLTRDIVLPNPEREAALEALALVAERLEALALVAERLEALDDHAAPLGRLLRSAKLSFDETWRLDDVLEGLRALMRHYRHFAWLVSAIDDYPESYDVLRRSVRHGQIAQALRSWRFSTHELARVKPELAGAYDAAAETGAAALQRFGTMDELVRHYYGFHWRAWIDDACGGRPDGRPLWHGIVREAAFWRRARQLIAESAEREQPPTA